jgi:predicted CXXCH cytochrome family protein
MIMNLKTLLRRWRVWPAPHVQQAQLWAGSALAILAAGLVSCATVKRTVMAPPQIPGATFVGAKSCAECHEDIVRDFKTASHARMTVEGVHAADTACEGCHGPGSLHAESGEPSLIFNSRKSPDACYQCHLDIRGRFNLPHRHPVDLGRVTCQDCHSPHKGPAVQGGTALLSQNDTCLKCHSAQRGPYVYEHEAMREGCVTCHHPHGSVNAKMLTARNANLCLKCHFQQQTASGQLLIGGRDHSGFPTRGTCWTAGCHEAVHGSHVNSSLRY